jgi:hypothetical protein
VYYQNCYNEGQLMQVSLSISETSGWKNVCGRCHLKVSWGIAIWTGSTNTSSVGTLSTYSTKFKLLDGVELTNCFNLINVRIVMVPIENNYGFIVNIRSSSSSYIPEWKS